MTIAKVADESGGKSGEEPAKEAMVFLDAKGEMVGSVEAKIEGWWVQEIPGTKKRSRGEPAIIRPVFGGGGGA